MIAVQHLSKTKIWCGLLACLMMEGIFCISGRAAVAITSTQVYTQQNLSSAFDQEPFFSDKLDWIVAKRKTKSESPPPEDDERVRRWNKMSPEEQQRYKKRYKRWKQMSPEERKRYEEGQLQWEQLTPDERKQIRNKLEQWDKLSPQEREKIRRWFKN